MFRRAIMYTFIVIVFLVVCAIFVFAAAIFSLLVAGSNADKQADDLLEKMRRREE